MSLKIYTREEYCPFCVKAKELLDAQNIEYQEITILKDIDRKDFIDLMESSGYDTSTGVTVPQIFDGDKLIGGYTEYVEYHSKN